MSNQNPFFISGPALVSFSGGRTSAYMLRRILDAHGGTLPDDVYAVFADTGKERPETYDFVREVAARWGVPIQWVERPGGFDGLVQLRSALPNGVARFCTGDLKIKPMRSFMKAKGFDWWTMVVGIRADEPARVARMRDKEGDYWDHVLPLAAAGVVEDDVMAFWEAQPFDLQLRQLEGNCDLCFLKSKRKLIQIMMERPDLAAWWIEKEQEKGHTFNRSHSYAQLLAIANELKKQQSLGLDVQYAHVSKVGAAPRSKNIAIDSQLELLLDDTDSKPCMCGD